jgi:transcriptional regulator with XRE-family HTH domain
MRNTVTDTVRAELARSGRSQLDLALYLRMPKSSVSRRMRGHTQWSADELLSVAAFLGIKPSEFFVGVRAVEAAS